MTAAFQGLFALLNRSLQMEDRSVRSHLARFGFVGLSYLMVAAAQKSMAWSGAPGLDVFRSMCYLNFFCITVGAVGVFTTAITEEKEDMTLGLLKMAGVSSLALLIGKSTPRLITALVLLTAQLPFTMLAVTLGGVSLGQVFSTYTCLLAYLVFVCYLALFFSVACQRAKTASLLTGVTLFLFFFGPIFSSAGRMGFIYQGWLASGGQVDQSWQAVERFVIEASAYTRVGRILNTGFADSPWSFQVFSNVLMGLAFLLLAWLGFEPFTRNEKPASEERGLLSRRIGTGSSWIGAGRAWGWALGWKDFHFVGGGKMMFLLKLATYLGLLGLIFWTDRTYNNSRMGIEDLGTAAMIMGFWGMIVELGVLASRVFYTETKAKTLSSLILLPKSAAEIGYSKVLGAGISLLPAIFVLVGGIACASENFFDFMEDFITEPGGWYFASQIVLFIHLAAVLSLYVKWGAMPLAFAAIWGGNILMLFFASMLIRTGPEEGLLFVMALAAFAACFGIHYLIGHRLKTLAAT